MVKNGRNNSTKMQKSRAKYKCPPELEDLIYQVNLLPPSFQLRSFRMILDEKWAESRVKDPKTSIHPPIHELLEICLKDTPEKFQKHIESVAYNRCFPFGESELLPRNSFNLINEMAKIYLDYYEMRSSMLWLLQRLETERHLKGDLSYEHFSLFDWDAFPLSITTVLNRGIDGKLHITGLAALIGKFDDSRLRRCEICRHIFWAKRENSKTCSHRCLNILNVRKSRSLTDEEKAERKLQREKNETYKQKTKKLKEKKSNGTL